jgi:hypothetical protein
MPVFVDFKHQSLPRQMNVQSDGVGDVSQQETRVLCALARADFAS